MFHPETSGTRATVVDPYALTINVNSSMTDTSFDNLLCSELNSSHASVTFSGTDARLVLPECFRAKGTNVSYIYASAFAVNSFSAFPLSTKTLRIVSSFFIFSGTGTGFKADGSLDWDQIWQLLPNLESLDFQSSSFGRTTNLPSLIPENLTRFNLASSKGLSSSIPPTIFNSVMTGSRDRQVFEFQVSRAGMRGSIPPSLFVGCTRKFESFKFDVSVGSIIGFIPQELLWPFADQQWSSFEFFVESNILTGIIPGSFYPANFLAPSGSFAASFGINAFSSIHPTFLGNVTSFSSFSWTLNNGRVGGSLPPRLFPGDWSKDSTRPGSFRLDLLRNSLEGTITPSFFTAGLATNATFTDFYFTSFGNRLDGAIPETLFYKHDPALYAIAATSSFYADFSYNNFGAPLPEAFFTYAVSSAQSLFLGLMHLPIAGTIPNGLHQSIPDAGINVRLDFSESNVFGSPPSTCWTSNTVTLDYASTNLNGVIPSDCNFRQVSFSKIPSLSSSLPPDLFNGMEYFYASKTPLSGALPRMPASMKVFDVSYSQIDVCANLIAISNISSASACELTGTNVCNCLSSFSRCYNGCPPSCSYATRPSTDFSCIGGFWVAERVDSSSLAIPEDAGTVLVLDYLASTTIQFGGLGSKVNVSNPATNLSLIHIDLSDSQAKAIEESSNTVFQILINIGAETKTSSRDFAELSQVKLIAKTAPGCRKVVAKKSVWNNGRTFGAYFSIDSSGCNRNWIIAVAVSVVLVFIILVAIIALAVVYKPFRECVRPFSKPRKASSAVG